MPLKDGNILFSTIAAITLFLVLLEAIILYLSKNNSTGSLNMYLKRKTCQPAFKADFLSWQKSLSYSLRIFAENFSLLLPL